ncbi:MAG: acetate--CoA ligase family protein [Desulfobacterales bacterium]|nr:acetate--CoA ligase family protein [Desulfobacterales bacterium]
MTNEIDINNPLVNILSPKSIAILGASNNPFKMGTMQFLNLLYSGFSGDIFPIHPEEKNVFGIKAYPSINSLPYAPDMAMLVVPPKLVVNMIDEFGKIGTRYAVIITAGFKETGEEGIKREQDLIETANKYGFRFLGPNCMGLINTRLPLNITATPVLGLPGNLSLASQSGTYIAQTTLYLQKNGIRLNKAVSVGNEANIDLTDCLEYFGNDIDTKAIGLYIECIRRPEKFLEVARKITKNKPIVAQYVGGTEAGSRAGSSHTGSMAGPDYIYNGLFEQAGVIRVNTIEEVYCIGNALALQPKLKGNRIGILTNSGGPGTAIASTLDSNGLEIPTFSENLQEKIKPLIAGYASSKNPVDLTFHVDMSVLTKSLPKAMIESDEIDGLIVHGIIDTGWAELAFPVFQKFFGVTLEKLRDNFKTDVSEFVKMPFINDKPVLVSSFFGLEDNAVVNFHEHGIPVFNSPEKAAFTMAKMYQYAQISNRPQISEEYQKRVIPENALKIMSKSSDTGMDEYLAKKILREYGINTCEETLATSLDEAINAAKVIGYPIVLKGCSPLINHKTEQGLVYLNITNNEDLKGAWESIEKKAGNIPRLVCRMVKGDRELIAGIVRTGTFPPCVMLGLGGIFAEALDDKTIRFAPLTEYDALSMLKSLKSNKIFESYRNMNPIDKKSISSLLISLGNISIDFPQIKEIDLNPIIIENGIPKVVDALFVL